MRRRVHGTAANTVMCSDNNPPRRAIDVGSADHTSGRFIARPQEAPPVLKKLVSVRHRVYDTAASRVRPSDHVPPRRRQLVERKHAPQVRKGANGDVLIVAASKQLTTTTPDSTSAMDYANWRQTTISTLHLGVAEMAHDADDFKQDWPL